MKPESSTTFHQYQQRSFDADYWLTIRHRRRQLSQRDCLREEAVRMKKRDYMCLLYANHFQRKTRVGKHLTPRLDAPTLMVLIQYLAQSDARL